MKTRFATWTRPPIIKSNGTVIRDTYVGVVRVMAVSEGYSMVRFKRAMPFVVPNCELTTDNTPQST